MRREGRDGRWPIATAVGAAGLVMATSVHAATLGFHAPADCERADEVQARVEDLSGRPLATLQEPNFSVNVTKTGDGWTLTLVTEAASGTSHRELSGRTCAEVTDAAAVAMAMAIRAALPNDSANEDASSAPEAVAPAPAAPEAVAAPPAPVAAAPRDRTNPTPPTRSNARRVGGFVGVGMLLDTSALPGPTVGAALEGGLRFDWLRVELEGEAFAPRSVTAADGGSGSFNLLGGALLGCVEPPAPRVSVFGCGGFELGELSGEGHDVTNPAVGTTLWTAGRLEAGVGFEPSATFRLAARLGVAVPFNRRQFVLDRETVHEPAPLSLRAALAVDFLL